MFIKYSTGHIRPKKSRGKVKKKTSSKRRVKKKVTLSADDNIIFDDPDASLELAKSISQTEAEEAEAARKVHATHAKIVTEFIPESAKKKSSGRKQEVADIMQALKESKKTSRRQPDTGGSNEGTGVPDEEKDITEEKVILEWGDEQDSEYLDDNNDDVEKDDKDGNADDEENDHISDTQDADDKDAKESPSIATATTLPPLFVSTTPFVPQQTTTSIPTPPTTTDAQIITTAVSESNALSSVELRSQVPSVVDNYLGSKVKDVFVGSKIVRSLWIQEVRKDNRNA
ncbi:hypothetical protein Tco_1503015 [Tanacetum coccineum]